MLAACGGSTPQLETADPGVVFTFPIDGQVDVPIGSRIVVTFSDPVAAGALGPCTESSGAFCVVGPNGPVGAGAVTVDGRGVELAGGLEPGTKYDVFVRSAIAPDARNLPASGPLFSFTTRNARSKVAAPSVIAINGAAPASPDAFRPMLETSTIRLVFSEPLDPRTVTIGPGAIELVDGARVAVPVTLVSGGIHVALDPIADLTPGTSYEVRVGNRVTDLGGTPVQPITAMLTPAPSLGGKPPIRQILRTRQPTDPGPELSRSGAERNRITMDKPIIGRETSTVQPSVLEGELGDPKALGGPIAFTIRRGQRLSLSGLDIKLGGEIPANLSTGDIFIEFLTDGGGRLYRNPYQPADQRPENLNAPLYVDLSMDVAVYTRDPMGNAVIAQTVLGCQSTGTAIATDGVLALETVGSMELGILGVTTAPTNLVLELITDLSASVPVDSTAPTLLATSPPEGSSTHSPGDGIELVFDEPVDLDRLRAGGLQLLANGVPVQTTFESHGSTIVVRPLQRLAYSTNFSVVLGDVADVAGNSLADTTPIVFSTLRLGGTGVPLTVAAVHPGVPCALTGGTASAAGRCAGGDGNDELYGLFDLPANEPLEVVFTQPVNPGTITLGTACGVGSVRIEQLDAVGTCTGVVAGTLIRRDRGLQFVPEAPWTAGQRYRLALISGGNNNCDGGEICGISGDAASFDPLAGTENGDAGGPALVIDFVGADANNATFLFAEANPFSDVNGSGFVDGGEPLRDENRAALRIVGTTGDVSNASFAMQDCLPATPETEGCMYLLGAMPVQLGELERDCALPDGTVAPSCIPVGLAAQAMFATSLSMDASVGITINTDTGTSVMRIREPAGGPVKGFIVDGGSGPKMVVTLELYMDAPDMSIPLSSHDLHSKPLSIALEGPVTFQPDGRIVISLSNIADVTVAVNIDAPLGIGGSVQMLLPTGEMKLQLLSRLLRGVEP